MTSSIARASILHRSPPRLGVRPNKLACHVPLTPSTHARPAHPFQRAHFALLLDALLPLNVSAFKCRALSRTSLQKLSLMLSKGWTLRTFLGPENPRLYGQEAYSVLWNS